MHTAYKCRIFLGFGMHYVLMALTDAYDNYPLVYSPWLVSIPRRREEYFRPNVFLSVRQHIYGTTRPICAKFLHVTKWPCVGPPVVALRYVILLPVVWVASIMFAQCTWWRNAYTQSDSPVGSTDLTPWRILKLSSRPRLIALLEKLRSWSLSIRTDQSFIGENSFCSNFQTGKIWI